MSRVSNVSFNITNGNAVSLRDLAGKICAVSGSESDIDDTGDHPLYPNRGTLDISRARDLLGYQPETDLEQGLKNYLDWYNKWRSTV